MTSAAALELEQFRRRYKPVPDWCLEAIAECPRAFGYEPPSRGQLRALHLEWILYGTPGLTWPFGCAAAPLTLELQEVAQLYTRAHDGEAKRLLAIRARRIWARLVEMADGLWVEISPGVMGRSVLRDDVA